MAEFRNIIADGDLVRQRKLSRWWLFGDKDWAPYRNLSREVRYLEDRMHTAHAAYKAAQEDFVVSQKNVRMDIDLLRLYKAGNSEVSYEIPSDESIIVRRDGVKYVSGGGSQNQKQKGSGNQGQAGDQKQDGGGNNQNQQQGKKQQQQRKPTTLMEMLMNTKVVTH